MSKDESSKPLAQQTYYNALLGLFHGSCASLDLTTDYAICKFLYITAGEAHLITSGMMFGRKARLLADLVGRSEHPRKAEILGAFNKVRANKRDIITHGYVRSTKTTVTFVERSSSGEFKAIEHTFTLEQFSDHVQEFAANASAFYFALGATRKELNTFALAALSLNRKSKTSSGKPVDRK